MPPDIIRKITLFAARGRVGTKSAAVATVVPSIGAAVTPSVAFAMLRRNWRRENSSAL